MYIAPYNYWTDIFMYPFGGEINGIEKGIGFTEGFMNEHRLDGSAFVCVFA